MQYYYLFMQTLVFTIIVIVYIIVKCTFSLYSASTINKKGYVPNLANTQLSRICL